MINTIKDIYASDGKDPYMGYLLKRWNRIASALYVVSAHIKDNDQIKWNIRSRALDIMSFMHELMEIYEGQKHVTIDNIAREISLLMAEISLASTGGLIGRDNQKIIQEEITIFQNELINYRDKDAVLSPLQKDFMKVEQPSLPSVSQVLSTIKTEQKEIQSKGQTKGHLDEVKKQRRESILRLLKNGTKLGIKDFIAVIKGCSEKTIQRELTTMVEEGVLYKEGDRRWSMYSLKKVG